MNRSEIGTLSARFRDPELEAEYRSEAWPILRVQFGLTLCGLALGLLITLSSDFAYLKGTSWFNLTAGIRGAAGLAGALIGLWLLLSRPVNEAPLARYLIQFWFLLGLAASVVVAIAYPAVEATEEGRSDVLIFTCYWMCVFAIVIGFGFYPYPTAVGVFCAALAITYLSLVGLYWSSATYPKVSQAVLVVMACAFGWIMAVVTGIRTRRRFHLMKLYEEAQAVAEKGLGLQKALLAATGHDMRQPIYALDLNAASLETAAELGDLDKVRLLAGRQRRVVQDVTEMISTILRLSQVDTGQAGPEPEDVRVTDIFDEAIEPLRDAAADKGLEIRIVPTALSVHSDRGILVHVLSNLAANAVAHSGARRLVCGARRRGRNVQIIVADNGSGIGPTQVRYSSLDDLIERRPNARGTGLGMEIIFQLAARGGLALEVSSEPSKGLTATISAPASSTCSSQTV